MKTRFAKILAIAMTSACMSTAICAATQVASSQDALPASIAPPADAKHRVVLMGSGSQVYECRNDNGHYTWHLVAPLAYLKDEAGHLVGIHYAGPQWQAFDGSRVSGRVDGQVQPDAHQLPWLRLDAKQEGGTGLFDKVVTVVRMDTVGGVAPKRECWKENSGETEQVPYKAHYLFFSK